MTLNVLFVGTDAQHDEFVPSLRAEFDKLPYDITLASDIPASSVDYIVMAGMHMICLLYTSPSPRD